MIENHIVSFNLMLAATHAAFSTALYLGGAAVFEYKTDPVSWGLAILFSFMPDIDLPTSRVGRPLFWLSVPMKKRFGCQKALKTFHY